MEILREDPVAFATSVYFEEDDETTPATKNLLLFLNESPFFINAQFLKGFGWFDSEYFEVPKENIIGWMDILDKINLQKTK